MAVDAGCAVQAVVVIDVALDALHGGMESSECEAGRRMVNGGARPVGGGVAGVASGGEPSGFVRRIIGAVIVSLMAVDAGRVIQAVVVINMALRALHGGVESGECETGGRVVEGSARPVSSRVAQGAVLREPGGFVGRTVRAIVVG